MMTKRTTALLVAMVIPASAALAAQRQSIRMDVDQAVTLAGKAIPAGSYKLSWQGDGDAVKVRVAQGRKVVAEADGRVMEAPNKAAEDSLVWQQGGNGAVLSKVLLRGSTKVLVLAGS
jgi:hypothetical protein